MEDITGLISADFTQALLAFLITLATYAMGLVIYCTLTPHSEVKLMRAGNPAAALSFSATAFAFAIALAAAVHNTQSPIEVLLWGANALLFQVGAYLLVTRILPELNTAITEGKTLSALPLAVLQIAIAILNAAVFVT
jgi:putative membrane protein